MRCLLNIWGVMLFLRLTWVIGQAGLLEGLTVIALCNFVTIITGYFILSFIFNFNHFNKQEEVHSIYQSVSPHIPRKLCKGPAHSHKPT
jgi:hypothetical protein